MDGTKSVPSRVLAHTRAFFNEPRRDCFASEYFEVHCFYSFHTLACLGVISRRALGVREIMALRLMSCWNEDVNCTAGGLTFTREIFSEDKGPMRPKAGPWYI